MNIELVLPNEEDAWFWFQVRNQASTRQFNPVLDTELEALKQQILETRFELSEKKKTHRFFVKVNEKEFAGVLSLKDINWETGVCELGYLFAEKFHGQGIATKAVGILVDKAFTEGNLRKIKATTAISNIASKRVLEKNRFLLEGILKDEFIIMGRVEDVCCWGLLKKDYMQTRNNV